MQGKHKKFNKNLYKKYDQVAKEKTKEFLVSQGAKVLEPPNQFVQDIRANKRNEEFWAECEVKNNWSGAKFPFPNVQLPERKKKFFKQKTLFFIWNKEVDDAIIFWSYKIYNLSPVEVKNKYMPDGELFYQIPLNLTKQISIDYK